MKILFCGYRDWAINVYNHFKDQNHDIQLAKSPQEFKNLKKENNFDLTFLVGWSWIINEKDLEEGYTAVLHPSDLPDYAGGSPIQHQIIDGIEDSKVTLFKAVPEVDAGPIIYKEPVSLRGELKEVLVSLQTASVKLIAKFLQHYPNTPEIQQTKAAPKKRRTPEMSKIKLKDFEQFTAKEIHNKIRALQDPYPNAFVVCKNNTVLFLTESHT
tara:strand:+ start:25582 stop:26220 length:639 start_codon:yes stop_codon:yes gene_type:complete